MEDWNKTINKNKISFGGMVRVVSHQPRRVLLIALLILGALGLLIPGLGVSTSRRGLVDESSPLQHRLLKFFDDFGHADLPVMVIQGGETESRRRVVDRLLHEFSKLELLKGRLLAKVGPLDVAETLLLLEPEFLHALAEPQRREAAEYFAQGLPGLASLFQEQIQAFALSLQMQAFNPLGPGISEEKKTKVLQGLRTIIDAASHSLDGKTIWDGFSLTQDTHQAGVDSAGYLVGSGGDTHLIAMYPHFKSDETETLRPAIEQIRAVRDRVMADLNLAGIRADLTGIPTMAVDEIKVLREGIFHSSLASALGILAIFMFAFRSFKQTILAAVPLLTGIIATLGITRLLFDDLNLITSSMISVLMGLGIDFAVHALARYNEFLRELNNPREAIAQALLHSGPAIFVGALTTALAFLTTATTEFTAFSELGILTAIGLGFTLLATFFLIPSLLTSTTVMHSPAAPELPGFAPLPAVLTRYRHSLMLLGVLLLIISALWIPELRFNPRHFDFIPQRTESARGLLKLENDQTMGPLFTSIRVSGIEEARILKKKLLARPEVLSVQSASDLLPPLAQRTLHAISRLAKQQRPNFETFSSYPAKVSELKPLIESLKNSLGTIAFSFQASGQDASPVKKIQDALDRFESKLLALPRDGQSALLKLQTDLSEGLDRAWKTVVAVGQRGHYTAEDLPPIAQMRFASLDLSDVALYVFPRGNAWDQDVVRRFNQAVSNLTPHPTGFLVTSHAHMDMIVSGFYRASLLAAILVIIILCFTFGRLDDVLLALLPLASGWIWMLGTMSFFDIPFNVATIVALPLILGIGIDSGVHVVHRTRESSNQRNGPASLPDLLKGTGGAIFVSGLTTMAGFAGLMVSDYGAMWSLGITMVVGVGCCLVASIVFLPTVLILLGRAVIPKDIGPESNFPGR